MKFFEDLVGAVASLFKPAPLNWWIEITTDRPQHMYYFGPFDTSEEAQLHLSGYLEDLQQEGAKVTGTLFKQIELSEQSIDENLTHNA